MGSVEPQNPNSGSSIKFPLSFSGALAAVAGLVTLVVSAGGTVHGLRWDLAAIAFGMVFVVTLLLSSLLVMGHKENEDYLSAGSGVNRRSSDRLKQIKADNVTENRATEITDDGETPSR